MTLIALGLGLAACAANDAKAPTPLSPQASMPGTDRLQFALETADRVAEALGPIGRRDELAEDPRAIFELSGLDHLTSLAQESNGASVEVAIRYKHKPKKAGRLHRRDRVEGTDDLRGPNAWYSVTLPLSLPLALEVKDGRLALASPVYFSHTVEHSTGATAPSVSWTTDAANPARGIDLFRVIAEGAVARGMRAAGEILELVLPQGRVLGFVRGIERARTAGHPVRKAQLVVILVPNEGSAHVVTAHLTRKPGTVTQAPASARRGRRNPASVPGEEVVPDFMSKARVLSFTCERAGEGYEGTLVYDVRIEVIRGDRDEFENVRGRMSFASERSRTCDRLAELQKSGQRVNLYYVKDPIGGHALWGIGR